ncbi:type IV inositol polyphosphate 5-phosphatase 9-like isoform X2 [Phalaenopsis equestris]|uniref:type IV inositol polyphosphate 5-phosphatase 9-like isoform X2 n=1 Tax=Phalaenopsis equestris TaxID=78828 RepID=UPI0009E376F6|nr:type IV inositol polyphosphate 5-phosphatase 9-like isoform X2 [Phalaenopsis equestris]
MSPEKAFQSKMDTLKYKVLVSTWNVGGLQPSEDFDLEDLLQTEKSYYDIYVLGFQEIVPLTAKNIMGPERRSISARWNSVIGWTLNKNYREIKERNSSFKEYECMISKQMVGIMVTVWVRGELLQHLHHLSVSCVACGFLGFLGNKGAIAVRFVLHGVSMCFVCCHLASGGKEGDEVRRNSDAIDILSRTTFPHVSSMNLPRNIFEHDQIILLGDLNYRISLPETETKLLVERKEWNVLLKKDQLALRGGKRRSIRRLE